MGPLEFADWKNVIDKERAVDIFNTPELPDDQYRLPHAILTIRILDDRLEHHRSGHQDREYQGLAVSEEDPAKEH
jgi:hypothetical protein